MHPQLRTIERELESATRRATELAGSSSDALWRTRPPAGGWSAGECVAHLNLTSQVYLPLLDEALDRARALKGTLPSRMRRDLMGWLIWKSVAPSGKMKVSTTPAFVPSSEQPKEVVLAEFTRLQGELLDRLRRGADLPLHRVRVASPFNGRVRYSVYSGFSILAAHEHRHLNQAQRALAAATS